jgi:hypothetical protein
MSIMRFNEPKDPELRKISLVLPDHWIDEQWPIKPYPGITRCKDFFTSQMVRIHLLTLVKRLGSFNREVKELQHNTDFRRFCRLRNRERPPAPATLSKFRSAFGAAGWRAVHLALIRSLTELFEPPRLGVVLLDSSDLPGAVRRAWKKKTTQPCASAFGR